MRQLTLKQEAKLPLGYPTVRFTADCSKAIAKYSISSCFRGIAL